MPDHIQISPMGDDYSRLIQLDRERPSKGITTFILKDNSKKKASSDKYLTESLKQLRNYCELVGIRLKIQVIDFSVHNTYYDIMFEFVKYFLDELPDTTSFVLNMGEDTSVLNLALLNAAQYVKTYSDAKISMCITINQNEDECVFEYDVQGAKDLDLDNTTDKQILLFIKEKLLIKDIAKQLDLSIGSISNRFHQFKEKGLITIDGRKRRLTHFGNFILKILTFYD
jgi:hypothetical protein